MEFVAPRVLVVDDDMSLRRALSISLTKKGIKVVEASNGEQALTKLKRQSVDLIILDLVMPQINGFQFLERLPQVVSEEKLPTIIVLSNLGNLADIFEYAEFNDLPTDEVSGDMFMGLEHQKSIEQYMRARFSMPHVIFLPKCETKLSEIASVIAESIAENGLTPA